MSIKSNISIANHKYIKKYYSIIALTLVAVILITINLLSSANSVNDNEVVTQDNLKTDNNSLKDLLTSIVGNIESQENIQDIKTNNQPVNNTNNTSNQSILSKSYFPEFDNQYNDSIQVRAKSDMLIYQNNKQESDTNNTKVNIIKTNKLDNLESKILQGKIISAILETEINSDLPGMIRAVINDNVYSESNDNILIPKGSRLIGKYNSDIVMNQSRVFIEWNRLITPNGVDIEFLSPGVDAQGQAGLTGEINNHHAFRFSQAMLSSLINITAIPKANKEDTKKIEIYKKALLENINNNAQEVIKDNIDIKPTINIKAGTIVNVFVAKDIEFNNEDI